MKRYLLLSLMMVIAVTTYVSCPLPLPLMSNSTGVFAVLPTDGIGDVLRSTAGAFAYETLLPVELNLDVKLYDSMSSPAQSLASGTFPADGAAVIASLRDSKGNLVYAGRLLNQGHLSALVLLPSAPQDMTLTLQSDGFVDRTVVIPRMVQYAEVTRSMGMLSRGTSPSQAVDLTLDSDGDLIPDVYDAFPTDPNAAFAYRTPADGNLTVAYEDLYGRAQAGDADYNDFIAKYFVKEIADGRNLITRVEVEAQATVKLAGYNHQFGIRLDRFEGNARLNGSYIDNSGKSVVMTETMVTAPVNVLLFTKTSVAVGKKASFRLDFDTPQSIGKKEKPKDPKAPKEAAGTVDRPPYNPYLYVLTTSQEIHLMDEQDLSGTVQHYQDSEGFPWGLLVPTDWLNPAETQRIEVHYPRFTNWRQSFGAEHTDWYLHYDDPYVPPVTTHAYVAGSYVGAKEIAAYWVDDEAGKVDLFTVDNSQARSIYVSGSDIYAAGYYTNSMGNTAAAYWNNGTLVTLYSDTAGGNNAVANGVFVAGNGDVYVAGRLGAGGLWGTAGYWKNGTWVPLYETTIAEATGIVVSGMDVYVSGYYYSSFYTVACYWKNGVKTDLYVTTDYSEGNAIAVAGTDVYVAGYRRVGTSLQACSWVNDQATVTVLNSNNGFAKGIAVAGTVVYVAGFHNNGSGNAAASYWTDGVETVLYSDTTGTNTAEAYGIFVLNGDVYVAGNVNAGTQTACYWKNGVKTDLYTAGTSSAFSVSVTN